MSKNKVKKEELLNCDLYELSGCCTAPMWNESDICGKCGEHSSPCCDDCEDYNECENENKV